MRCEICKKTIKYEILQTSLFYFHFICKDCSTFMKPKRIDIPFFDGYLIEYYYFVDNERYENEVYSKLYLKIDYILKRSRNKLVIFLDYDNIGMLQFLRFRQNIVLISIVFEDPLDFLSEEFS